MPASTNQAALSPGAVSRYAVSTAETDPSHLRFTTRTVGGVASVMAQFARSELGQSNDRPIRPNRGHIDGNEAAVLSAHPQDPA